MKTGRFLGALMANRRDYGAFPEKIILFFHHLHEK